MTRTFTLRDQILVHAPAQRCFSLSTSLALVARELHMHPVPSHRPGHPPSRTAGNVRAGETVLWKGWQLGLPQFHHSLIDPFHPPTFFRDRMIAGRFRTFEHDHNFLDRGNGSVLLQDELRFSMPFGFLGALIGRFLLVPHIRGLMHRRFAMLKRIAESEEWRQFVPPDPAAGPEKL